MNKNKELSSYESRVALVTGGSKGIGFAIAQALAKHGIELVLAARDENDLATAKKSIQKQHPDLTVHTQSVDLTKKESYVKIHDFLKKQYGRLDILVNNAGDFKQMPADGRDKPDELFSDVYSLFAVNALPAAVFSHVLMPLMLNSNHPQQLDVLSSAALEIFPGNNPYGPSKAAHERISLSTVADSNARICTYRVYPSNTNTKLTAHFDVPKLTADQVGEEAVRMMLQDEGTDLYMKMTNKGLVNAQFTLDYCKHVKETDSGDVLVDGLGLVSEHRMLIRAHFEPVIRGGK